MTKKLVVISLDAMGASDLTPDNLAHLPNLKAIVDSGAHVENVTGIYPTLTYPSHTSIITGTYPKRHGIVNNTKIQPQRLSPDWFWYRKDIQATPLYDVARKSGLTTAAFLWPVTAKAKITYNMAEIFPNRIWTNQVLVSMRASSPVWLLNLNRKYGHLRQGIQQPYLDDFVTASAVDTILKHQPDLTLIHLVDMDSMRHRYGVESTEAHDALKRHDLRVAKIIQATKDAHVYGDTVFAILGDHYQINVNTMIRLNARFAEKGWLTPTADGLIQPDWQVLAKSADGSTYIYLRDTIDSQTVVDAISDIPGIETIHQQNDFIGRGADPQASLMVEAKAGYYFIDNADGPVTETVNPDDIGQPERYRAVHGFDPNKPNYKTTIVYAGPGIKQGITIPSANLVDEGPTFAQILGLEYPVTPDGEATLDIFDR
ncbi:ectonucleotide pyrophosphatase/phosphodiesterase [Lacticaseibacillus brantae]|uniref:Type I phosphodiesterase nucleotide pyrophosphatase n=1 Tax=Lacticaseibacillus brantae DSM 23927 TaxID=1423727 RepID=A0A0R2AZV2_9LACO|nr:ectonucleotide pyrophosphatase/phosphodiesterase [Lacticaseibacillus brantae]KRM72640.1 type I phosphodiesterase nucleotide pyrophosphatase [Lacticaseibacillus brantae DSM 23927]